MNDLLDYHEQATRSEENNFLFKNQTQHDPKAKSGNENSFKKADAPIQSNVVAWFNLSNNCLCLGKYWDFKDGADLITNILSGNEQNNLYYWFVEYVCCFDRADVDVLLDCFCWFFNYIISFWDIHNFVSLYWFSPQFTLILFSLFD